MASRVTLTHKRNDRYYLGMSPMATLALARMVRFAIRTGWERSTSDSKPENMALNSEIQNEALAICRLTDQVEREISERK